MSLPRPLSSYRPQHDEGCEARPHYNMAGTLVKGDCDCGLDAALEREQERAAQEEQNQWFANQIMRGDRGEDVDR